MSKPVMRILRLSPTAQVPAYMTPGAAGLDLSACLDQKVELLPGQRALIPTGIAIELPQGYEGQVRPRSGLSVKFGLTVLNAPGTIDADYRGEVKVPLINLGQHPVVIEPQMRVAQLVIAPVCQVLLEEADALTPTERDRGGFGHTG